MEAKSVAIVTVTGASAGLLTWYLTRNKEKTTIVTGVAVIGGVLVQGLK